VLSATADLAYKCTEIYAPEYDRALRWDDPTLAIAWPLEGDRPPLLSAKDAAAPPLAAAEGYP
jgi:dTDP-4-dehydrorhamnose 3,5-epimerase